VFGCSPYKRETYRYTPLLALLLAPNAWLHPSFGKYLFAVCDLVNGWLIYQLLVSEILPYTSSTKSTNVKGTSGRRKFPEVSREGSSSRIENASNVYVESRSTSDFSSLATLYTALHLFNPLVFTISTRGSSESVLALFILLTLYEALKGRWGIAAMMLGLSAHWKIYPVVYGVACLGIVGASDNNQKRGYLRTMVNTRTVSFAMISAGTFGVLGVGCYLV
jgi:phosphatidylinositol glycan class M